MRFLFLILFATIALETKFAGQINALGSTATTKPSSEKDVANLIEQLRSEDLEQQNRALDEIGRMGPAGAGALPDLVALWAQDDDWGLSAAGTVLGMGDAATPYLLKLLDSDTERVRTISATLLADAFHYSAKVSDEAVAKLIGMLDRKNRADRLVAMAVLEETGARGKAAIPKLVSLLSPDDMEQSQSAMFTLVRIEPTVLRQLPEVDPLIPQLQKTLGAPLDPALRARRVVVHLGPKVVPLIPDLVRLSAREQAAQGWASVSEISQIDQSAIDPLVESLKADEPQLRSAAVLILRSVHPTNAGAIAALKKVGANDPSEQVRLDARVAIEWIEAASRRPKPPQTQPVQ